MNILNKVEKGRNFTFPLILPKNPLGNFTDYTIFEHLMLNLRMNRMQAKEVI